MAILSVIVGCLLVLAVLADVVNTLVTTTRSSGRYWLTVLFYTRAWRLVRAIGGRMSDEGKERLYGLFAPLSVIGMLAIWVTLQVFGFGLIWWGLDGIDGAGSFGDSLYYSGVVYFTLGFGEIVPSDAVPRAGALFEAFSGVLTTALVIGYLPALYGAYSQREQKLLTLDDGTEERMTPTNLVMARCPNADPREMDAFFGEWEAWAAQVMETHTTFRMLTLFRSQHPGQNWITALGVVMDAALHIEMMEGGHGGPAYWFLRRGTRLLQMQTEGIDLEAKTSEMQAAFDDDGENRFLHPLYDSLSEHGFPMRPYDEAFAATQVLREKYAPAMEQMIDILDAPRGFWGHAIGHRLDTATFQVVEE